MNATKVSIILLLLLLLASCEQSIAPLTQAPALTATAKQCRSRFQEVTELTKPPISDEELVVIVDKAVEASEYFLNNCTNSELLLSEQPERLAELRRLGQFVPPSVTCAARYTPTTLLMDLDQDGSDELVLHTQAVRCDHSPFNNLQGAGGLSAVFDLNTQTDEWHGTLIWPCSNDSCPWRSAWVQSPQPEVTPLDIRDSQGRAFMLVAGRYYGADHTGAILTIWRWEHSAHEIALEVRLSDWCGTPNQWEISDDGYLLIPGAEETSRCEARDPVVYVLQEDEFVARRP